ncbi:MAG: RNA-guided endonuclease IscB [Solobacterium sp.]|nr:RNA-guided endonuclease IscB [Solobacterium sp.]MDD5801511.1 RNA-guided endonuclease IscB [Solobacterium sp.]MDY5276845.1 RNA-guided endonuclease IscB [Erysipelotrichaceae bacterium]MDY5402112.1 RNA-guided endonuclease IscB [Erysipelotrichaceae bacterium]
MQVVYVLNKDGLPLMPTHKLGKVRHLLKDGKAKVVKRSPFTIQLNYDCGNHTQSITLGVDAGSKHIGLSASTKKQELYCSDVELRDDVVELLSTRRRNRRSRRNHLRYRPARFDNRKKEDSWLAPSIRQKIDSHLKVIEEVHKILPITNIIVEVASFDIQKIKNPDIEGIEYQNGEQLNSYNIREYVLFRDNHTCQCCKGKSKDRVLEVHHIESRKTGGNAPSNLITLCKTCHKKYHKGEIILKQKRGAKYDDASFMGIMRWDLYNKLKETYPNVSITYGYITKSNRIKHGLAKEHYNDAYCISQNFKANPLDTTIYQKKVRCHNRQIHKANFLKSGIKKLNQAPYIVKDFRLFDKVRYQDEDCFIFGRRSSGYFDIRKLDGTIIHRSASYKKLELLEARKSYLKEERSRQFLPLIN